MKKHNWKLKGSCVGYDINLFFDTYEEKVEIRPAIDQLCRECPVRQECFATGVSNKEWGIWGGVYLENGKISREFNKHRKKPEWAEVWTSLTMEQK
jgi:hypothetical protein